MYQMGGAHWRNLANMVEPSMRGGDEAFLSNYFDHLYNFFHKVTMKVTRLPHRPKFHCTCGTVCRLL